jgi:putative glutamine amidotransferase
VRIGLSYHGGDSDYDAYPQALARRAQALGVTLETLWLAGRGIPSHLEALDTIDAIVLTGGPDVEPGRYGRADAAAVCRCDPKRDAAEWAMLEQLRERPRPMLAVCRGAQMLNVFYGGSLIPDLGTQNAVHRRDDETWRVHDVSIRPESRLCEITGVLGGLVNSSHHQAVHRLAEGFRTTACSRDDITEAFEPLRADGTFTLAVQWHPELMEPGLPLADRVLDAFLRSAS